jgi:hypothetical protein
MQTRYFALIMGIIFLVIGIAGFIPALVTPAPTEGMAVDAMHGRLFGLFPINALHNLFHAAFGIWGIAAYRSFTGARTFAKVTAVVYAVLLVMGFIPVLNTTFGLVPLYSHDIWLHALIAIAAAYFGFRAVDREAEAVPAEGRR